MRLCRGKGRARRGGGRGIGQESPNGFDQALLAGPWRSGRLLPNLALRAEAGTKGTRAVDKTGGCRSSFSHALLVPATVCATCRLGRSSTHHSIRKVRAHRNLRLPSSTLPGLLAARIRYQSRRECGARRARWVIEQTSGKEETVGGGIATVSPAPAAWAQELLPPAWPSAVSAFSGRSVAGQDDAKPLGTSRLVVAYECRSLRVSHVGRRSGDGSAELGGFAGGERAKERRGFPNEQPGGRGVSHRSVLVASTLRRLRPSSCDGEEQS